MSGFVKKTIGQVLSDTASRYPAQDAFIYTDTGLRQNYQEFYETCRTVARGFMALGIKRGENVSVWATNVPEWVYLQFGLSMIGAVLVTVNTNYKAHELEYILNQSDTTTLIFIDHYRDTSYYDIVKEIIPELESADPGAVSSNKVPLLKNIVYIGAKEKAPGMFKFNDILDMAARITDRDLAEREKSLDINDVVNMQYTSGTTGFPKGVMLTHYNIVNNARMVGDVMDMSDKDRLLIQVPLFHCFGCVMSTLNAVYHGSAMVVLEYFDPLKALKTINAEKCTAVNGVPTMFIAMVGHEEFDKYDMSSLRTGIMAGAPCPIEAMNNVRTRMHCEEIVIAFGQTESSPVMTMTRRNDPVELRVSTVGRLLPDIEGKIVDPETGADLPPGMQGEIVTRSSCVMKGYYKMPDATEHAIDRDGWLHTGDLGIADKNGYFTVTGRIKDMIIRGGENVYPREIEEFLHHHPLISDVYVVGIPDKKYGEQVLAAVQLKNGSKVTAQELVDYCTGKIARHKVPKYWEFVTEYPMTASGKVQKFKIRELFQDKYRNQGV